MTLSSKGHLSKELKANVEAGKHLLVPFPKDKRRTNNRKAYTLIQRELSVTPDPSSRGSEDLRRLLSSRVFTAV